MPTWDEHGNLVDDGQAREWDEHGRPVRRPRRGQGRSLAQEAEQTLATINRGIPFAQDLTAALGGARNAAQGGSFGEGYQQQAQRNRDLTTDFRERRPNAAAFAEGTGNALPVMATLGASAPQQIAGRGAGLFLNQSARAGASGAAWGAGYGAATGDAAPGMPLEDRLARGNQGAGLGAAFGAVTPAAVNAVSGARNAIAPAWQRFSASLPRIAPQAEQGVGMMGGQMLAGGRRPPPPEPPAPPSGPRIPGSAMNTIDRLADRNRMSPDDVEAALWRARENPQGQVTADIFGDAGVRTTRAIAQGPGQTGGRAAEVARARSNEQEDRILSELNRRLNVAETPQQAMASLEAQYAEASANLYEPLFARPMTSEARRTAETTLQRYANTPVFRDASNRAQRIFDLDRANGIVEGSIDDNFGRYLHYLKMGLDDASRFARTPQAGVQATEMRGVQQMRRQVLQAIDEAVPGYRDARNRWATLSSAEEALGEGATLTNQNADAIRARLGQMTDFERYHARVGFANEVAERLGRRGSVNGNRNIAEALGSPEIQRRVSAMFETPEQAAAFLDTLNQQNMLMRNAQQWGTGSQTYSNAAHGADEALNTMADAGVQMATGNPGGALRRGVQGVANAATFGRIERANNQRGEALLRRVDTPDSESFAHAVVAELRRRAQQRAAHTAASEVGARATGSQQGRRRR